MGVSRAKRSTMLLEVGFSVIVVCVMPPATVRSTDHLIYRPRGETVAAPFARPSALALASRRAMYKLEAAITAAPTHVHTSLVCPKKKYANTAIKGSLE